MEFSPSGELAFEGLAWTLVPSLVHPAVEQSNSTVRLRGVLRSGLHGVRVLVQIGSSRDGPTSLALEFDLRDLSDYDSDARVLAFLRSLVIEPSSTLRSTGWPLDDHGFRVVSAKHLGFLGGEGGIADEAYLLRILTVLMWGRRETSYEDVATFAGIFLKKSGDLIIYLQLIATGEVVGVHLPVKRGDGRRVVSSAVIPHELAALARDRFDGLSRLPSPDAYCSWSVDMGQWVGS